MILEQDNGEQDELQEEIDVGDFVIDADTSKASLQDTPNSIHLDDPSALTDFTK